MANPDLPTALAQAFRADGITAYRVTVPERLPTQWAEPMPTSTTFTLISTQNYLGPLRSFGTYDPQHHHTLLNRELIPDIYRALGWNYLNHETHHKHGDTKTLRMLSELNTLMQNLGENPQIIGVLLTYMCHCRSLYPLNRPALYDVEDFLYLIHRNIGLDQATEVIRKNMPMSVLREHEGLNVGLLLEMF